MKFKKLTETEKDIIIQLYESDKSRDEVQDIISDRYNISKRSVRNWARKLEVGQMSKNITDPSRIMIYDIETCRVRAWVWWTGKGYTNHKSLIDEPKIITISWKWLGEDQIYYVTWDKNHCDKKLMVDFLKEYNKADMVIGYNNDSFDNRWINARAMKHNLDVNIHVKSYDIMKEEKKVFRVPSYSMAYMSKYSSVILKQGHEGIKMWEMIQTGTAEEQAEYLEKMVIYNIGDIAATEELYLRLRKYFGHRTHLGVLKGGERFSSPDTGSLNVELYRRQATPSGTIQIVMIDKDTGVKYKISNRQYMSFLDHLINHNN